MPQILGELPPRFNRRNEAQLRAMGLFSLKICAVLIGSSLFCACTHQETATLRRQVGGATQSGPFVPPYAYESFIRGELAMIAGRFQEALLAYEQADAGGPADALVLARIAEVNERLGNHVASEAQLRRGLELFPRSEALWLSKARVFLLRGNRSIAGASLRRARCIANHSEAAALALSDFHREDNPTEAARVLHDFARDTGGTTRTLSRELDLALQPEPLGNPAHAAELAATMAARDPQSLDVAIETLRILHRHKRHALAVGIMDRLEESSSVPPTLRVEVLLAADRLDDAKQALAAFGAGSVEDEIRLWLAAGEASTAQALAEREWLHRPTLRSLFWLAKTEAEDEDPAIRIRAAERLLDIPAGTSIFPEARHLLRILLAREHLGGLGRAVSTDAASPP